LLSGLTLYDKKGNVVAATDPNGGDLICDLTTGTGDISASFLASPSVRPTQFSFDYWKCITPVNGTTVVQGGSLYPLAKGKWPAFTTVNFSDLNPGCSGAQLEIIG
jgi:hypothetical protein